MSNKKEEYGEPASYAAITALLLLCFLALFASRNLDNNSLTSWSMVFATKNAKVIFFLLAAGILGAYLFSRGPILERYPAQFLFVFSFFIAALFWQESEVILDASRYFTQAKHFAEYGAVHFFVGWGREIAAWTDLPAVPFFYGLILYFFGEERIYVQIFTTLLFSFTVVLTYLLGKKLWNEELGICAGLLLLGFPYLLTQVPLMLVDVPTMFFLMFAIYLCIIALERGGAYILAASIAVFLTFFSKISSWFMLSVIPLVVVFNLEKANLRRAAVLAGLSLLLIGTAALWKLEVLTEQVRILQTYQIPRLDFVGESYVSTFFFQVHPLITASALYSIYLATRNRDKKYLIVVVIPALIFLIGIHRIRYILPAFPMLALAASYALQEVKNKRLRIFAASSIAAASVVLALFAYLPYIETISAVNLKSAGEAVDELSIDYVEVFSIAPEDAIYHPAVSVPILDIFTHKKIKYELRVDFPPDEIISSSALRFTWSYRNPEYYESHEGKKAIVVIAQNANESYPEYVNQALRGYRLHASFETTSAGSYAYETIVRVYVEE